MKTKNKMTDTYFTKKNKHLNEISLEENPFIVFPLEGQGPSTKKKTYIAFE